MPHSDFVGSIPKAEQRRQFGSDELEQITKSFWFSEQVLMYWKWVLNATYATGAQANYLGNVYQMRYLQIITLSKMLSDDRLFF